MKKLILIIGLFACLQVNAQNLSFGVKGGINFSMLVNTDLKFKEVKPLPGFLVGLVGMYDLGGLVQLQAEALYIQSKFKTQEEMVALNTMKVVNDLDVTNGYLSFPLSVNIPLAGFVIGLGPQIDKIISSTATGTSTLTSSSLNSVTDLKYDYLNDTAGVGAYQGMTTKPENFYKDFGLSGNISLGYNFGSIRTDVRLNYSFNDAINDFYVNAGSQAEKTITGALTLTYMF